MLPNKGGEEQIRKIWWKCNSERERLRVFLLWCAQVETQEGVSFSNEVELKL